MFFTISLLFGFLGAVLYVLWFVFVNKLNLPKEAYRDHIDLIIGIVHFYLLLPLGAFCVGVVWYISIPLLVLYGFYKKKVNNE